MHPYGHIRVVQSFNRFDIDREREGGESRARAKERERVMLFMLDFCSFQPDSMNAMYGVAIISYLIAFVVAIVASGFACCVMCRCCRRKRDMVS